MHQSIPAAPSPPTRGYCGTFARLLSPGGWAFANFALPGGQAFANLGSIPELLTHTWFPDMTSYHIRIITTQDFTGNKEDWLICEGQEIIEEGCKDCEGMFSI